ncbi:MAG: hypothetical protein EBS86_01835 [Crocinitomicaceae bacterium]|nr:hypothetical protein [Crocinitomicaceae bacterium]
MSAVWSKASAYNAGSLVKLNNRYFLAKTQVSANSTSAGNPTPENQLSKWQEINVVGYENGGWNYAWWAQKPTITPTPNQSIEEIKKSWFEVLKNAISRVAPSLPITTGGFETTKYDVDSKPNILHDYLTASTFNDYVTKVNNLSYKGPTVVEEYASEDWGSKADGRMYETKYLGKNSGAYQDLNIFRSTTDATAFITQSVEELNDFTNDSDDVWVRILKDSKTS